MSFSQAELLRRFAGLVQIGTVAEVDYESARFKAKVGELTTAWRPFDCVITKHRKHWRPLRVGAQVVLLCADGDLSSSYVVAHLYSDSVGADRASGDLDSVTFEDGSVVEYDSAAGQLTLKAKSSVLIDAPLVRITGDLSVDGEITSVGDMTAGDISQINHEHDGVATGGGRTGKPA